MPDFPSYDYEDEDEADEDEHADADGDADEFQNLDTDTLRHARMVVASGRGPADPLTESGAALDPREYLTASDIPVSDDGALARARHGADSDPSVGVYVGEQGFLRTVGDDYLLQRDGDWTLYVPDEWQLVDDGGGA
jgi:hypothetical protein